MTHFLKALFPGGLLTWLVALFVGSSHSHGGLLNVQLLTVNTYSFYWSWPLMFLGTGLAWAILLMMD